jgi:hypothetical protein
MMTEAIALSNGIARISLSVRPELPVFALGRSEQEGQGDANSQCGAGEHHNNRTNREWCPVLIHTLQSLRHCGRAETLT